MATSSQTKGKHGGRRAGAGRKPATYLAIRIGMRCEELQQAEYQRLLSAKYEGRPDIRAIRSEQAKIAAHRSRFVRPKDPGILTPKSSAAIDKLGRFAGVELRRPLGVRQKVLKQVAAEFQLSADTINRHWKTHRRLLRRAKLQLARKKR